MRAERSIADVAFALTALNGNPLELAHYRRRRHVLFVWASW